MKIDIISLFPEFFDAFFTHSIIKRALQANRLESMVKLTILLMAVARACS